MVHPSALPCHSARHGADGQWRSLQARRIQRYTEAMRRSTRPGGPEQRPDAGHSLADQAYDRFREGLHSGLFKPGQRLLETELAGLLGMSRTPVREAIRRLQSEGLVAHLPARGLCVAAYDAGQVDELYVM